MKCLYFAAHPWWPVNSGARQRNYQLACQLAVRASVTFVELRNRGDSRQIHLQNSALTNIVTLNKDRKYTPSKLVRGLIGPAPVTVLNCWSAQAAIRLADVLKSQEFGIVCVSGTPLQAYLPIILNSPGRPALAIDWHNIESELMCRFAESTGNWAKKIAARRTAKLIERAEDRLLDSCALHTVTSERERQKLLARRPQANIAVIPNGVDTQFYAPADAIRTRPTVLFVGSMDYHANIEAVRWFCRAAWPEIARRHPDLQFTIVGRDPSPAVRALASDRIHVTGTVEDVRPYYASAVASVAPIRTASGTRLKILESMAAGVPVVSTRLGVEGLDVEDDVHFLLAENGQDMNAAIDRILADRENRDRLASAARALVVTRYDWSVVGQNLYRLHWELFQTRERETSRREPCLV